MYLQQLQLLAKEHALPHAMIIECKNFASIKDYLKEFLAVSMCTAKDKKPCKKCPDCIKIESDSHPDIKFIEPEKDSKSIKIESIRNIREDARKAIKNATEMGEDVKKRAEKEIDDLTKEFSDKVDAEFKAKSEEIMKL